MTASRNDFPAHLTPLERQRLESLIGHLAAEPRLARVVAPSPEEERLTQIYRKKGLAALVAELKKF